MNIYSKYSELCEILNNGDESMTHEQVVSELIRLVNYADERDGETICKTIEKCERGGLVIGRYLDVRTNFQKTSKEFTAVCREVRNVLNPDEKLVVVVEQNHYLVETDHDNNFDVKPVPLLDNTSETKFSIS